MSARPAYVVRSLVAAAALLAGSATLLAGPGTASAIDGAQVMSAQIDLPRPDKDKSAPPISKI